MLLEIDGKPLIRGVYDKVKQFGYDTYVVTDSTKIASLFPKNSILTGNHENGTARIASLVDIFNYSHYINVQGDLIDVEKELVDKVASMLSKEEVVTAYTKHPTSVRVVHNDLYANWFTRANLGYGDFHVGIYGYSSAALKWYSNNDRDKAEEIEDLEQLRFFNKYKIAVFNYNYIGREINTKNDL
jgi:CMP-2-keto-3-deoxyoctulosonic acid synthetase